MTNILQDLTSLENVLPIVSDGCGNDDPVPTVTKNTEEEESRPASPTTVATSLPPARRRRVRFAEQTTDHPTPYLLQEQDHSMIWYTTAELDRIKIQNKTDMQARSGHIALACMRLSTKADGYGQTSLYDYTPEDWTWRGFEYVLWRVPRATLRLQHKTTVLNNNQHDELASMALESSEANGSPARAFKIGKIMRKEASEILERPS